MSPEDREKICEFLEETTKYITDDFKEHVDNRFNSLLDLLELVLEKK